MACASFAVRVGQVDVGWSAPAGGAHGVSSFAVRVGQVDVGWSSSSRWCAWRVPPSRFGSVRLTWGGLAPAGGAHGVSSFPRCWSRVRWTWCGSAPAGGAHGVSSFPRCWCGGTVGCGSAPVGGAHGVSPSRVPVVRVEAGDQLQWVVRMACLLPVRILAGTVGWVQLQQVVRMACLLRVLLWVRWFGCSSALASGTHGAASPPGAVGWPSGWPHDRDKPDIADKSLMSEISNTG